MFKILGIILGIIILLIGVKLITSKSKRKSQLTSGEKIAQSLNVRVKKLLKDLEKGIRTPEVIREEIIQELDKYKQRIIENMKNCADQLIEQKQALIDSINNLEKSINYQKHSAIELKRLYDKSSENSKDRESYLESGVAVMDQVEKMKTSKQKLESLLEKITKTKDELLNKCDLVSARFEIKKSEILTLIAEYVAGSSNNNFGVSINFNDIDFLITEYKTVTEKKQMSEEIDNKFSSQGKEEVDEKIDNEELKNKFLGL